MFHSGGVLHKLVKLKRIIVGGLGAESLAAENHGGLGTEPTTAGNLCEFF